MNPFDAPLDGSYVTARERVGWSLLVAVGVGVLMPVAILLALQMIGATPSPLAAIVPCVAVAVLTVHGLITER